MTNVWTALLLAAALAGLGGCNDSKSSGEAAKTQRGGDTQPEGRVEAEIKEQAALKAGVEAVVYGLPLVIMDITKQKSTNVAKPEGAAAPINQFGNVRAFPDASFKDVVRANVDTLYSSAFLDLGREPIVLSVPDTRGRYYLMPMLDAWTNVFASPGKRTTGTNAGRYAITGPGWTGTLPKGVTQIKSPTNMVWIIGRTQTDGPKDYPAVHAVQDGYKLAPLSAFGKPYKAPTGVVDPTIDMKTPPVQQLQQMGADAFFNRLAALLASNPPPASEAPVLEKLKLIGIVPGQPFDPSKLDPAVAKGLEKSLSVALEKLQAASKQTGAPVNGWSVPPMILGNYGAEYGTRAVVALVGLGANLPQDAVYPSVYVGADGAPLNGAKGYVIHFDKGALPPARAFWSITMYGDDSFFVANSINRYAISSWMPLKKNADGSLDVHVQPNSPGKAKETNWLPSADGPFNMTLRIYWPEDKPPSILDGSWAPPPVRKAP
jgi:hypothetical protein